MRGVRVGVCASGQGSHAFIGPGISITPAASPMLYPSKSAAVTLGASAGACAGASSMRVNLQSVRGFVRSVCLPGWCALAVKRVGVVLLEGTRSKERRKKEAEEKAKAKAEAEAEAGANKGKGKAKGKAKPKPKPKAKGKGKGKAAADGADDDADGADDAGPEVDLDMGVSDWVVRECSKLSDPGMIHLQATFDELTINIKAKGNSKGDGDDGDGDGEGDEE